MKPAVLLLLCLALCGCGIERNKLSEVVRGVDVYDGCEYLCFRTPNYHWTHKGNCTNAIHGPNEWRYVGPRYPDPSFPISPQFPKGYIENPELAPRSQTLQRDIPSIIPEPTKPKRKEK